MKTELLRMFFDQGAFRQNHALGEGFLLASGVRSPYYVDCRQLMGNFNSRRYIVDLAIHQIANEFPGSVDAIGGMATGAISLAMAISDGLCCRTFYVRSQAKTHGTAMMLEGSLRPNDRIVLVDDVLTSGRSLKMAADKTGARQAFVIVDREEGGKEFLNVHGITVISLITLSNLINRSC